MTCRDMAIEKITKMQKEQVTKVLIFMAGMEAEQEIRRRSGLREEDPKASQQSA